MTAEPDGGLQLSGDVVVATYRLRGTRERARELADAIRVEQTIEYPLDLVERADIRDRIVASVRSLEPIDGESHRLVLEYPREIIGRELTQLLNVLFGNISLQRDIRLEGFELPPSLLASFKGPRYGRKGLAQLVGGAGRPLLCTALKPVGLSSEELADLSYRFALGGIDIIKEDHGLTDPPFSRFAERVQACTRAVRKGNKESGHSAMFVPNVTAPAHAFYRRAHLAATLGAGGLLAAPGLMGFDTVRVLAEDDNLGLPILSHPSLLGGFTVHPGEGIDHGALYGQLNRLVGADGVIFPNHGGRFPFTEDECRDLVDGTSRAMGRIRASMPMPAGGMSLERVEEMVEFYGPEVALLIGGDLHRHGDLVETCRRFRRLVEEAAAGTAGS